MLLILIFSILNLLVMIMLLSTIYTLIKESIHPMTMLFLLISFTSSVVLFLSKWFSSYFFSYLTFMVFIGGILITFLYLVSLTNMDKYSIKLTIKDKMIFYSSLSFSMFFTSLPLFKYLHSTLMNYKITETFNISGTNFNNEMTMFINFMYSYSFKLTIISIFVLLFMLISVVKICSKHSGPLRQTKKF